MYHCRRPPTCLAQQGLAMFHVVLFGDCIVWETGNNNRRATKKCRKRKAAAGAAAVEITVETATEKAEVKARIQKQNIFFGKV